MLEDTTAWYASWFDTPYYHILYKDRDYQEAQDFMNRLTQKLELDPGDKILDLACGKGRHSIYLNSLGFDVTGADLSQNSIAFAKKFENEMLHFKVHDMCKPFGAQFDAVFNLFTSFGYFEKESDNFDTIKAIKADLKPKGHAVIDFMNVDQVIANLVPEEVKEVNGITFYIKRYVLQGYIYKTINFKAEGKTHAYTEKVKALRLSDFEQYITKAGLQIQQLYGDYQLDDFDRKNSTRLIVIFG